MGGAYQFQRAAITKYHKLGSLKQQKCIISQFWSLEVWNQGVGRAMIFLNVLEEDPSLSIACFSCCPQSLACRHISAISASIITWHSLCVSLCPDFPLLLRTSVTLDLGLGPTLIQYDFLLAWLHLQRLFWIRWHSQMLDGCKFWGDTIQSSNTGGL